MPDAKKSDKAKKATASAKQAEAKKKNKTDARPPGPQSPKDPFWKSSLLRTARGELQGCTANVVKILTKDKDWEGVLQYDEFISDVVVGKPPPWTKDIRSAVPRRETDWRETDMVRLAVWLSNRYGIVAPTSIVKEAVHVVAERVVVHPLRDWLLSLKDEWDGEPRVDTLFTRLAHAKDTPLTREVSKNFLISAVARIFKPGCQVDSMPILEGDQGIGKTSFLKILAGEEWFLSTSVEPGSKDSYQILKRKWIVEFGELDSMTRSEASKVRQYVSQAVDSYRPSYGTKAIDVPRQAVFSGTVNPEGSGYLKDNTGARRFWPVACGGQHGKKRIWLKTLRREREQIWAEAVVRFLKGEEWHITDPRLIRAAAVVAEDRRQTHPWEQIIGKWLSKLKPEQVARGVTTYEVMTRALGLDRGQLNRGDEMVVSSILTICGWGNKFRGRRDMGRPWIHVPDHDRRGQTKEGPKSAKKSAKYNGSSGSNLDPTSALGPTSEPSRKVIPIFSRRGRSTKKIGPR